MLLKKEAFNTILKIFTQIKSIDTSCLLNLLIRIAVIRVLNFLRKWYRLISAPSWEDQEEPEVEMYTKREFAIELKERISEKQSPQRIADWAYDVFNDCINHYPQKDKDLLQILYDVRSMEIEKEYKVYGQKLNKIANKLIKECEKH